MRKRLILFHFLFLIFHLSFSQKVFDFNTTCQQAYKEIIQLRLQEGQRLINVAKAENANNLIPFFLENYIDFFELFFNEDPSEYKRRIGNRDLRLDLLNEGPENSPLYLYTKAVLHFQWAAVRIKFGHNWDAGWEFRRSFLEIKDNLSSFPSFSPNLLYSGVMQVAAGTVPDGYKWLSNLLGIKGSIKSGMENTEDFLHRTDQWATLFHDEAAFFYCYLKFYIENDKEGVFRFINNNHLDIVNNQLFAYLAANLSINNQQAEKAEQIIAGRNNASGYFVTPVWDMEMGYARLHHLQPDAATYLERFIADFKGKFYVKDVLQKLSWYYYLQGNQAKADQFRKEVMARGSTDTEADKQAQKDAASNRWPDKLLLQARLLNDGGYHREALKLLHGKTASDFKSVEDQLEFSYRVGRLYDDIGADNEAIEFYKQAIEMGESRKEYYAARAALQIGFILEQKGDKTNAITWFQRCLNMKDHDFKNSLDQRAKAGIARCKGE